MTTLKEFEDELRRAEQTVALGILEGLKAKQRAARTMMPARRISAKKMTPELAKRILELHRSTPLTQQQIAFQLQVNQGRVNEVIKHGKHLDGQASAPEAKARDEANAREERRRSGKGKPKEAKPWRTQLDLF